MKSVWITTLTGIILLYSSYLQAQEAIIASGGNAQGSGGTVSFSAGQIAYTAISSTSGSIAQGIQQPYEIYIVTGADARIALGMAVYPNPTSDFLNLKVDENYSGKLIYSLFDMNGSLLRTGVITDSQTIIQTRDLAPAQYHLTVSDGHNELKTFKIIKNK